MTRNSESSDTAPVKGQWFLVKVLPRLERRVADVLLAKGYEVFLPMCTVRRQWSDRVRIYDVPLFTCYLFCRFTFGPATNLRDVLCTTGVTQIHPGYGETQPIPEIEVERLRCITASQYPIECLDVPQTGDIVEIPGDTAITGVLVERAAVCRVAIGFDTMTRTVVLRVPLGDLRHTEGPLRPHWSLDSL